MANFRLKASLYRENAEEIRLRVEDLKHEDSKAVFLQLADDYDRMANDYDEMERLRNSG